MPNKIKYTLINPGNSIKIKNFALGVRTDARYSPTSTTGFWNGITPPVGGYTIYCNKLTQGPAIFTPNNDTELIDIGKKLGAGNNNTLKWFTEQTDMICVNSDYPNIVTGSLIALYDSSFVASYPRTESRIIDLSFNGGEGTLSGGIEYTTSVNGGFLTFDGPSSFITLGQSANGDFTIRGFTICAYIDFSSIEMNERIIEFYDDNSGDNIIFSRYENTQDLYFEVFNGRTSLGSVTYSNVIDSGFKFYAVTVGSSNTRLFANSNYIETNINLVPNATKRDKTFFGKSSLNTDSYFTGKFGVLMVYENELTIDQVRSNYAAYVSRYGGG